MPISGDYHASNPCMNRKVPKMIPVSRQTDFREAMSRLLAAVNVITTDGPAGRHGMTASAICSVTDAPPTVLVCVNRKSGAHEALLRNGVACVNILRCEHEQLACHFAGFTEVPREARFASGDWQAGELGLPRLASALASLEGRIADIQTVGSHSVLFIEVDAIHLSEAGDGLAYFGRAFNRVPLAPALASVRA
jgi:flavin reductase (NADH)